MEIERVIVGCLEQIQSLVNDQSSVVLFKWYEPSGEINQFRATLRVPHVRGIEPKVITIEALRKFDLKLRAA